MTFELSGDAQRMSELLERYGGEVDDFFKLWPPDKQYFFGSDGRAGIAYGVRRRVAICMGGPAGAAASMPRLLLEFSDFCHHQRWRPIFIQTSGEYQPAYRRAGLHRLLIGADAVIELEKFNTRTVRNKYFRNIVNRFDKRGFEFSKHSPPHSHRLIDELHDASQSWLKLPHHKEWAFLTGRFDNEYLQQVPLYVLRDGSGQTQAFVSGLPSFKPGTATIDLMRHRRDSPPNSIDYLFIRLMKSLQAEGYTQFNLGMSPLDGRPFADDFAAKLLLKLYRSSNNIIGFRGLHQFKAKYEPAWEPRYVWYQGNVLHLVRMGLAVSDIMTVNSARKT